MTRPATAEFVRALAGAFLYRWIGTEDYPTVVTTSSAIPTGAHPAR